MYFGIMDVDNFIFKNDEIKFDCNGISNFWKGNKNSFVTEVWLYLYVGYVLKCLFKFDKK